MSDEHIVPKGVSKFSGQVKLLKVVLGLLLGIMSHLLVSHAQEHLFPAHWYLGLFQFVEILPLRRGSLYIPLKFDN